MSTDWRAWVFDLLTADTSITAEVDDRIYSTLQQPPELKPFIVVRVDGSISEVHETEGAESTTAVIWVDDDPGTYTNIDRILGKIRAVLENAPTHNKEIRAIWQGDSPDLSDDARGTVVRSSTFRLVGRR